MSNDVTAKRDELPDYLREYEHGKIGNIDTSDRIIPRIKLLQALSPELEQFQNAKAGMLWHTVASQPMGQSILGIPIVVRKSYVLWAPRGDERGILARAMDGIHWDVPDLEITLKPKDSANSVTYRLGKTVAESGLAEFGTSVPGDQRSTPIASLTYNMLWYFPEFPELSPAVIINTRSGVKPSQELLTKIEAKGIPHYLQVYEIKVVQAKGPKGTYYNYTYHGEGYADAETAKVTHALFKRFEQTQWAASDETGDTPDGPGGGSREQKPTSDRMASKF
jgi:hypothetical protein